jgi:hypothetical protein
MLALFYCEVMKNILKTVKIHMRNEEKKMKLILEHRLMSYGDICANNCFGKKCNLNNIGLKKVAVL